MRLPWEGSYRTLLSPGYSPRDGRAHTCPEGGGSPLRPQLLQRQWCGEGAYLTLRLPSSTTTRNAPEFSPAAGSATKVSLRVPSLVTLDWSLVQAVKVTG